MKASNLILKELVKRGYSLEGKTRVWNVSDYRLLYLTPEQAKAYTNLKANKKYIEYMSQYESDLLKKHMPQISKDLLSGNTLNVIDLASFDGRKAIPVLNAFSKKAKMRYCPVDAIGSLVSKAISNIRKSRKAEVIKFKWNVSDFNNIDDISSLLKDNKFRQNLFLFLGSIISNFDPHDIAYKISQAADKNEDYLLLSAALSNKNPNELTKIYKHESVDEFTSLILKQIGFAKNEIDMEVRYRNMNVEVLYNLKNDKEILIGKKNLHFRKGDKIVVATSSRYNPVSLKKILKSYFGETKFYLNNNKSWALILCRK